MNRDLKATAQALGLRDRELRSRLRELRILSTAGELLIGPRTEGRMFIDPRSRWNKNLNTYSHYGVVMTTEAGVAWLAEQLGITVTTKPPRQAGSQA
ncbi:hypothetical protein BVH03_23035 [Pseudomonas sp. PA15(2017)]|uniref:hypothetical protein n=1 Tax=Pseudomonas sp. PA15(2017) TaxID=1932111 RepID=UPI000966573E|nr:hypothetical protein [Pseudomonas sp. PA15(2017)]OLU23105.1 hypothetical protein BVH03_23035 [Pseudomonas sp. PA15(2017)]